MGVTKLGLLINIELQDISKRWIGVVGNNIIRWVDQLNHFHVRALDEAETWLAEMRILERFIVGDCEIRIPPFRAFRIGTSYFQQPESARHS